MDEQDEKNATLNYAPAGPSRVLPAGVAVLLIVVGVIGVIAGGGLSAFWFFAWAIAISHDSSPGVMVMLAGSVIEAACAVGAFFMTKHGIEQLRLGCRWPERRVNLVWSRRRSGRLRRRGR